MTLKVTKEEDINASKAGCWGWDQRVIQKFIFENNLIENKLFLEKIIKKIKSKKNITDLLFRVLLKLIKVINFK